MNLLLEIVGTILLFLLPDLTPKGRGRDRRLMTENKVRCAIRATQGRVLNIGTEWSTGVCEINREHLRFVPSMGIVGDREIEVIGLRSMQEPFPEPAVAPWGRSAALVVTTEAGELYWLVPEHIADEAIARLSPLAV